MEPVAAKVKLSELQSIISKMSLEECCAVVLPELGLRWTDVKQAVRNSRLPMTPRNVAKILQRHVAKSLTTEEARDIVALLRIKLVALSTTRVWHVVRLSEPLSSPEPAAAWARLLPARVTQAARRTGKGGRLEVHSCRLGDFVFLSLSRARTAAAVPALYVCVSAGQPLCAVTSPGSALLRAAVEGIGYKRYEDAQLHGRDLVSLMRMSDRQHNVDVGQLTATPEYAPRPVVTGNCIDYTYKTYNEQYVDKLIGPDPPLINKLVIKSVQPFFDATRLNKTMSISLDIRSDDMAQTLKHWVAVKAIAPTSPLFKIFNEIQTNKVTYNKEDSD